MFNKHHSYGDKNQWDDSTHGTLDFMTYFATFKVMIPLFFAILLILQVIQA